MSGTVAQCGVILGLVALLAAACATSKGAQPEAAQAGLSEPRVPQDPLDLVVWAPEAVAVAQVQQLRSSPWFPRLVPYIERAACVKLADWDALLAVTQRAALAARTQPDGDQWLLVLDGRYVEADVQHLLGVAQKGAPGGAPNVRNTSGRFAVSEQGMLAGSVLDGRMLVIGSKPWVSAALESIARPAANYSRSAVWSGLGSEQGCAERGVCLLSAGDGFSARALRAGLSSAGAKGLGEQLQSADSVVGLTLGDGLSLGLSAQLRSAEAAQSAQQQLRDWLWQANLLIRLTGLPAVLDAARLSTQQSNLRGELDVSRADLETYDSRARPLFDQAVPDCNVP